MAPKRKAQPKVQPSRPARRAQRVHKRSLTSTATKSLLDRPLRSSIISAKIPKDTDNIAATMANRQDSPGPAPMPLPVLKSIEQLERPARFWQGATVEFRVAESIKLLEPSPTLNIYERIACIHDITETLSIAHASLQTYGELYVSSDSVNRLAHLLQRFKADSHVPTKLAILNLGRRRLEENSSADELDRWHKLNLDILRMSKPYAIEKGFERLWADASQKMTTIWLTELQRLAETGSELQRTPVTVLTERAVHLNGPSPELQLTSLNLGTSTEAPNTDVQDIISFYKGYASDQTLVAGSSFFSDLDCVYVKLRSLLSSGPGHTASLMESHVRKETQQAMENWCQRFNYLWNSAVKNALEEQFQSLSARVDEDGETDLEYDLTVLGDRLETAIRPAPKGVDGTTWAKYYPSFADDLGQLSSHVRLAHLYATFQDTTYRTNEKSLLWLLTWRSLKTIYCLLRAANKFNFPEDPDRMLADRYSVDKAFFQDANTLLDMEHVLSLPETHNVKLAEDLVARYCQHVSECRRRGYNHYFMFARLGDSALTAKQLTEVEHYHKKPNWTPEQHILLHRMALRMNNLLGGAGKTLRRRVIGPDQTVQVWMALDGVAPANQYPNPAETLREIYANNTFAGDPSDQTPETNMISFQTQRIDGVSQRTLPSAFPYVRYPFADTRATLIMQSRQITREMATDGYITEGPRESDIVNIPPRHVNLAAPSALSWGVTDLVRGLFRLRRISRRPRLAMIPGRLPSRSLTDPILDPNARVRKPPSPARNLRRNAQHRPSDNSGNSRRNSSSPPGPDNAHPNRPNFRDPFGPLLDPISRPSLPQDATTQTDAALGLGGAANTTHSRPIARPAAVDSPGPDFAIWADDDQVPEAQHSDLTDPPSPEGRGRRRRRGLFERPPPSRDSASGSGSDDHGSDQDNNPPGTPPAQHLLCHPCPQAGAQNQWHHLCDPLACRGYQAAVARLRNRGPGSGADDDDDAHDHNNSGHSGSSANSSNAENRNPNGLSNTPRRGSRGSRVTDGLLSPRAPLEEVHVDPHGFAATQAALAGNQNGTLPNNGASTNQPTNTNSPQILSGCNAFQIHNDTRDTTTRHVGTQTASQATDNSHPNNTIGVGATHAAQAERNRGNQYLAYTDAGTQIVRQRTADDGAQAVRDRIVGDNAIQDMFDQYYDNQDASRPAAPPSRYPRAAPSRSLRASPTRSRSVSNSSHAASDESSSTAPGPGRGLYELMTVAELRAELIHRSVRTTGLNRRGQMITRLLLEDTNGNMGRGAHGRRSDAVANGGPDPGPRTRAGSISSQPPSSRAGSISSQQQQSPVAGPSTTITAMQSRNRRITRSMSSAPK